MLCRKTYCIIQIWKKICLLLRKVNFHMVEDMYILYNTILFVESIALRSYRKWPKPGSGNGIYRGTKREGKKKVGNFMQIVSSYGVEMKKRIYRSVLRWIFLGKQFPIWFRCMQRPGKNFQKSGIHKNALMQRSIWYMKRKRIMPGLRLIGIFLKCHLTWEERRSNTHLEQCPPIKHVSVCGKRES